MLKKIKKTFFVNFFTFFVFGLYAQNITNLTYDRAGVSVILVDENNSNIKNKINNLKLDNRYDFNQVKDNILNISFGESEIKKALIERKVASQALLNVTNLETLIARVKYNLSDNQVSILKSTVRGIETAKDEKWIKKIITNNYIMVLKFENIVSQDAIYDKKDLTNSAISIFSGGGTSNSKRILEGFKVNVKAVLFKIDLDNEDYANFINLWDKTELQLKYDYKLSFISKIDIKVDGTQLKEQKIYKDLYLKLLDDAASKCLQEFGNIYFPIALKTSIFSLSPISAKIGSKENIKPDQLFFVFEQVEKGNNIRLVKKGTLRVENVAENRRVATGSNPISTFYKVHWSSLQEGMLLIPKKDAGTSMSIGFGYFPFKVYNFQLANNLSKLLRINNFGQMRLYLDLSYTPTFEDNNSIFEKLVSQYGADIYKSQKLQSFSFGVGVEKDIYVLPGIQLTPFASINLEKIKYQNLSPIKNNFPTFSLPINYGQILNGNFGLRCPINLTYNFKVVPSIFYSTKSINGTTGIGSLDSAYPDKIVFNKNLYSSISFRISF